VDEVRELMNEHLPAHYAFYGEYLGVRTARKHIGWYVQDLPGGEEFRQRMNLLESTAEQLAAVDDFSNRNSGMASGYNTGPRILMRSRSRHRKESKKIRNIGDRAATTAGNRSEHISTTAG
jgi:hypothetical protein